VIYCPFTGPGPSSQTCQPLLHSFSLSILNCFALDIIDNRSPDSCIHFLLALFTPVMAPSRPKPSEIAAEAKRVWMPYIWKNYIREAKTSYLYPDATQIRINVDKRSSQRTRVAVMEGDPVTYALGWYQSLANSDPDCKRIPVVNVANEKRAGGDWESGLMAPEECFARRSNLVHALTMPWNAQMGREENFYPIPQKGGIYSPQVCKLKQPRRPRAAHL
jgi:hypothetical protein